MKKKTKKIMAILLFFIIVFCPFISYANPEDTIVYITDTGSKYHSYGCGYLRSCNSITLEEAVKNGYEPCSRCNPPILDNAAYPINSYNESISKKTYTAEDIEKMLSDSKNENSNRWNSGSSKIVYVENDVFHLKGCPKLSSDGNLRTLKYLTLDYDPCTYCRPLVYDSINDVPEYREFKKRKLLNTIVQYFVAFGIPTLFVIICCIVKKIRTKKSKDDLFNREYDYYFSIYAFFPPEYFCNIPKGDYIKDGLPCSNGYGLYGKYTVYYSPKGECYHHRATCSRSKYQKSGNIVIAKRYHRPCSRCTPIRAPDLSWYYEYIRISEIKKKYGVP